MILSTDIQFSHALVTGACGYIGSALTQILLEQGKKVIALDRPGAPWHLLPQSIRNNITPVESDIRDLNAVEKSLKGIEVVFHTAALMSYWKRERSLQMEINFRGTENLAKACLENPIKRFIHVSSVNALGYPQDSKIPGDENTPFNWSHFRIGYMDSKYAADQSLTRMFQKYHFPVIILHLGTVYGPGLSSEINTASYIKGIAQRKIPAYPRGGTTCVRLEDAVKGIFLATKKGKIGERYILGGENLSYEDIFKIIAEEAGVHPPRIPLYKWLGLSVAAVYSLMALWNRKTPQVTRDMIQISDHHCYYSSEKAIKELGYRYESIRPAIRAILTSQKLLY